MAIGRSEETNEPETLGEYLGKQGAPPRSITFHSNSLGRPTYQVKEVRRDASGRPYLVRVVPVNKEGKPTEKEVSFSISLHSEDRRQPELS